MSKERNLKNGFIYYFINIILISFNKINLVELFKTIARSLVKETNKQIESQNIAIDIFIVSKWLFVFILWINYIDGYWYRLFTWYLIITNLHTYFYYHVWHIRAVTNEQVSPERMRRRFINLLLAIAFSVFSYAYLYQVCYSNHFEGWPENYSFWLTSLFFSLTNSVKGSGLLVPITEQGLLIMASQFATTYMFLAIMISRSVPQFDKKKVACPPKIEPDFKLEKSMLD
ncbi:hypothetical protein [Anaeromusa acidaminophila]|uniref:hypothetical protein n=1 Tax=Anaeromusa acidaminophila TaxID=81464 RepID=UPI0003677016|nr:hypothetical protein [Anaeromusa acidaminophila]